MSMARGPRREPMRGKPNGSQCPGYPPGSCLTLLRPDRALCSFCTRSKECAESASKPPTTAPYLPEHKEENP